MNTCGKIGTFLAAAAMVALEVSPAFAVVDDVASLPGPGAFGLVVAGIAAAIFIARRSK